MNSELLPAALIREAQANRETVILTVSADSISVTVTAAVPTETRDHTVHTVIVPPRDRRMENTPTETTLTEMQLLKRKSTTIPTKEVASQQFCSDTVLTV